jgi:hypothetical protein
MTRGPTPTPDQIRAYLVAHDWQPGWAVGAAGTMFVRREPADDGTELTVFLPASATFDDYAQRVLDIGDTLAGTEGRPRDAVLSEIARTGEPRATMA